MPALAAGVSDVQRASPVGWLLKGHRACTERRVEAVEVGREAGAGPGALACTWVRWRWRWRRVLGDAPSRCSSGVCTGASSRRTTVSGTATRRTRTRMRSGDAGSTCGVGCCRMSRAVVGDGAMERCPAAEWPTTCCRLRGSRAERLWFDCRLRGLCSPDRGMMASASWSAREQLALKSTETRTRHPMGFILPPDRHGRRSPALTDDTHGDAVTRTLGPGLFSRIPARFRPGWPPSSLGDRAHGAHRRDDGGRGPAPGG